jgi:hypothetical protein
LIDALKVATAGRASLAARVMETCLAHLNL